MADAKRVIELRFAGVDDLSPKIANITKAFDQGLGSIDAFASPLANLTEQLLKVEAAVVVAGVALGTYAVTEAIKFQDATVELDKVLGDTHITVQEFGDLALDLSNKYGESAVAVQESFASFSAAGFAADEIEGLTESMLKLSRVSELNVVEGTEAALRILAGFEATAATLPRTLDLVNESTNKYGTNVANLTEALARAAPIAKQGNFSIEETIGVLTPIIEVFKSAEMSGSAFVTVIQRLTSSNKNVRAALQDLNVDQKDSNEKMRSARDILFDVGKAYQKLDPSQKAVTTQMLAGTEQAAKFAKVFNNIGMVSQVVKDSLAGVGTSVDNELKKRMAATSAVIDVFTTRLQNAAIIAGGPFLDAVKRLAEDGGTLGIVLQQLFNSEAYATFAAKVSAQMALAGDAIEKFALALPAALAKVDLSKFQEQLELLGVSFGGLFEGINLTTVDGLAAAIQKVVDVGTRLLEFNRGVLESIGPVITKFIELAKYISELDPATFKLIGVLGGAATAFTVLSPAISAASLVFGGFGKLIGVGGGILGSMEKTSAAATTLGTVFKSTFAYLPLAGAAGYAAGTGLNFLIDKLTQSTTQFNSVGEAMHFLVNGASPALMTSTEALAASMAAMAEKQVEVKEATVNAGLAWDVYGGGIDGITGKFAPVSKASLDLTTMLKGQTSEVYVASEADSFMSDMLAVLKDRIREVTEEFGRNSVQVRVAKDDYEHFLLTSGGGPGAIKWKTLATGMQTTTWNTEKAGKAIEKTGEKAEKAAEKAAKLALETEKLDLEWAKLESHNRELVFTANVDLQIEKVKAEGAQFVAVIETINTAIESTGETLLGLAKLFVETDNFFKGNDIKRLMDEENERRKQTFELQKEMLNAQRKYIEASTDRLNRGDALVKIEAGGLEPELKAVLFKIVSLAHIEASGAAGPLLLGLPNF